MIIVYKHRVKTVLHAVTEQDRPQATSQNASTPSDRVRQEFYGGTERQHSISKILAPGWLLLHNNGMQPRAPMQWYTPRLMPERHAWQCTIHFPDSKFSQQGSGTGMEARCLRTSFSICSFVFMFRAHFSAHERPGCRTSQADFCWLYLPPPGS